MQAGHDLGEQGFLGGAVAEVAGDRLDQRLFLAEDQLAQGLEPGAALLGRGHGVGAVGGALGGQPRTGRALWVGRSYLIEVILRTVSFCR